MEQIIAKLRYFPLGLVAGLPLPLLPADLDAIAVKYGVEITLNEVKGLGHEAVDGKLGEETMNRAIEDISQSEITITSEDEAAVEKAVGDVIKKYRAPRTVYATWGSNVKGRHIISRICDLHDGWR